MRKLIACSVLVVILVSALPMKNVHADIAPPESPPGTTLLPGNENTQVRMVSETVTLTVSPNSSKPLEAIAKTEAFFTMRNLGNEEEKMQVRFPLSFLNGNSDGRGNFPEISSIAVKINGVTASTRRENQPFIGSEYAYQERDEIPWAVFDVTFPPQKDVNIKVTYTVDGFGYYPYEMFKYILQTGSGWNGTIGSADIIVHLPYEANKKNVLLTVSVGFGESTPGGVISGNEIRWHFEDLEPAREDDIQILLVTPSLWESILYETQNVENNPRDGEAWGRLARAYKEIARGSKGWLREDPDGLELFAASRDAYEKCLALLPNDSLWQYGYADLLWSHYYFDIYFSGKADSEGTLTTILEKLQIALELDPNNQQAKDLLTEISYAIPDAVSLDGDNFVLLGLTATPLPPTPWAVVETPTFEPTVMVLSPTYSMGVNTPEPISKPAPLCGSAFLLPVLLGAVFVLKKNKTN